MVDPDNRRPVDYQIRQQYLESVQEKEKSNASQLIEELLERKEDGRVKLFVVYKTLQLRKQQAALFREGTYIPLEVSGKHKERVIAFARKNENQTVLVVAPRFFTKLIAENQLPLGEEVWGDTALMLTKETNGKHWKHVFTGASIESGEKLFLKDICKDFPLGLLTNF
jgi:(1->4)-alpha-D-glucan 1-alpha-D-glucosylmutase